MRPQPSVFLHIKPAPEDVAARAFANEVRRATGIAPKFAVDRISRGGRVVKFADEASACAALARLRAESARLFGKPVKAEWSTTRSYVFEHPDLMALAEQERLAAAGVIPIRKLPGRRAEMLLSVESRDLQKWEKKLDLDRRVLASLGGRRDAGEDALGCASRQFFEESRAVLGAGGGAELAASLRGTADRVGAPVSERGFGFWDGEGRYALFFAPESVLPAASADGPSAHLERMAETGRPLPSAESHTSPGSSHGPSCAATLGDAPKLPPASGAGTMLGWRAAAVAAREAPLTAPPRADPTADVASAFKAADNRAVSELGLGLGKLVSVCWVEVGAMLDAITPLARGRVYFSSPSTLGSVTVVTADGRKERVGHFLTMLLMDREVHGQLRAWVAELE